MDRLRRRIVMQAGLELGEPRYSGPRPSRRRRPATVRRTPTGGHIRDIVLRVERKQQQKSRSFATTLGITLLLTGSLLTAACAVISF